VRVDGLAHPHAKSDTISTMRTTASYYLRGGPHVVRTHKHEISTKGQGDARDVTPVVDRAVSESGLRAGTATVFVVGSTAGMTTIEFESGVVHDVDAALEGIAPRHADYRHHLRWHDDNGSSHVRAALVGPSLVVPFAEGKLLLGTWQQIVMLEFDTQSRQREIVIQIIGE
jgi:secondary thiamine-phosphate synthase enzyme